MRATRPISELVPNEAVEAVVRRQSLEARFQHRGAQLRNFHRHAHLFASRGLDAQATYQKLQELHELDRAERRRIGSREPAMPEEGSGPHLPMTSAGETGRYRPDLAHQGVMAPAWLDVVPPQVFFGYSGHVQMPRAANGISVTPDHPGMAGELTTIERQQNGRLVFDGRIEDTRDGIPQDEYDPTETYVWLRNWKYLLPFPPAPSLSRFTYQFEVEVYASLFNDLDNASFMSFVSVGEEADFTPGSQIPVSTDAGWPLIADLGVPDTVSGFYNGNYGYLTGASTVQRTFSVRAGKTPAIAVIVGAIGIIGMLGRTTYAFGGTGYSSMTPRSKDGIVGRVDFLYEPLGELAPQ